jgi:PleD family two-component response regulator
VRPATLRDALTEARAVAGAGIQRSSIPPALGATLRRTVLIVDDDAMSRAKLRAALEPYLDVVEAKDGMEAVELAGKGPTPAMIVANVAMPRVDGFTLAKIMKGNEKMRKVPIMLVAGRNNREEVTQALVVGACHYFPKTTPVSEILAKIRKILGA